LLQTCQKPFSYLSILCVKIIINNWFPTFITPFLSCKENNKVKIITLVYEFFKLLHVFLLGLDSLFADEVTKSPFSTYKGSSVIENAPAPRIFLVDCFSLKDFLKIKQTNSNKDLKEALEHLLYSGGDFCWLGNWDF